MKHCIYCASTNTKLHLGYCIKYDCLTRSGNRVILNNLRELNKMVVEVIKRKREKVDNGIKREIKVGDIIQVKGDEFKGELWEVLKLNPKKAVCKRENGETWNIGYAGIITE